MQIMFIETCEVFINSDSIAIDELCSIPHMFYAGDEVEIDEIVPVEEVSLKSEQVQVVFPDGSACIVDDSFFVRTG